MISRVYAIDGAANTAEAEVQVTAQLEKESRAKCCTLTFVIVFNGMNVPCKPSFSLKFADIAHGIR